MSQPSRLEAFYIATVAAILFVGGGVLVAGGTWLLSLGGSWHYLVAGNHRSSCRRRVSTAE